jgi:hypothetical protein
MGHSGLMRTSTALTTTAWVAGAALATAGVTVALSVLGNELLGSSGPVLSSAQVRADLAAQGPAQGPASPATAAQPGHSPAASPGRWAAANFSGGTVFAACLQHRATLTDWIPAQGYRTDGFSAGPAAAVSVRFESSSAVLVVTVTCPHGRPVFLTSSTAPGGNGTPGGRGTPASQPAGARTATPAATPAPGDTGQRGKGGGSGSGGPGGGGHGGDG